MINQLATSLWLSNRGILPGLGRLVVRCGLVVLRRLNSDYYGEFVRRAQQEHLGRIRTAKATLLEMARSGHFDAFFDVGSHHGEEALEVSEFMPTVCFEPESLSRATLKQLVDQSPYRHRITIEPYAALDVDGSALLYGHQAAAFGSGSSSLYGDKNNVSRTINEQCETLDFGRYVSSSRYKSILVKINAEGAEYRILRSLYRSNAIGKCSVIFCSYHDRKIRGLWRQGLLFDLQRFRKRAHTRFFDWE